MDIGLRIKELAYKNKITIKLLAEKVGISEFGLHRAIKNNDFKVSTLQRIADVLNVPISNFFNTELLDLNEYQNKIVEVNRLKMLHQQYKEKYDLLMLAFNEMVVNAKKADPTGKSINEDQKRIFRIVHALCSYELRPETKDFFKLIDIE